jgi:signal transduction histidine kinase
VTDPKIIERLAAHRTLGSAPREELAWLASHGTIGRFDAGAMVSSKDTPLRTLNIVLAGVISITVDRGAGPRRVMEWRAGDVTGVLPYSRAIAPPGHAIAEEAAEVLMISDECFPEMASHCPRVTAILVHVMVDRARWFTTSDLQDEKMLSLGRLAAGLAHELNNPASALARSAKELSALLFEVEATAMALGSERLSQQQLAVIAQIRAECDGPDARATLSPLERADREEAVADWMRRQRLDGETIAAAAETPLAVEDLKRLEQTLGPETIGYGVRAVVAACRVRSLTAEVQAAATRIHSLVAAIKGFTYMDQSRIPTPVAIGQGLADTLAVLGGKARARGVSVSIRVADGLPTIEGFGGELNQVWANLIANAIEAAPPSGQVEVTAEARDGAVVVRVVDDGPGIPGAIREKIFDPFFTTKPQGEGTGLGLDIAQRLVREHGGRIELESRPGHTEFRVTLPRR